MIFKKGYQQIGSIESVTIIKVKGVTYTNSISGATVSELYRRIWDISDLITTSDDAFFVTTNIITTANQTRSTCSEVYLE